VARQRTIAPGFYRNEHLGECAPLTRIFFSGLWCWADRRGRLADRPKRLKAEILPYDDADGEAMVAELAAHGLVKRYEAAGIRVLQIVNFDKYQKPHPKETESVLPDEAGHFLATEEGEPKVDPGHTQGDPEEGTSPASLLSLPASSSLASSEKPAGGRAGSKKAGVRLGPLGAQLVAEVASGLNHGLKRPKSQADADEFERRIAAMGGVAPALDYVAATCRAQETEPEGVGLLLLWLRDLGPIPEVALDTG
jgi:hypothetical protein